MDCRSLIYTYGPVHISRTTRPQCFILYYISYILCLLDPLFVIHKYRSPSAKKRMARKGRRGNFFYGDYNIESHLERDYPHFHAQRIKNTRATKSNARVCVRF